MGFWHHLIFSFYQNYNTGVPTVAEGSTAWIRVLFPADVFVTGQARTLNYVTVFPWKPTSLVVHWVSTWKRHVVIPKRKTCHYTDKSEQQKHNFHHRVKPRSGPRKCRYLVGISCIGQRVEIFCLRFATTDFRLWNIAILSMDNLSNSPGLLIWNPYISMIS